MMMMSRTGNRGLGTSIAFVSTETCMKRESMKSCARRCGRAMFVISRGFFFISVP